MPQYFSTAVQQESFDETALLRGSEMSNDAAPTIRQRLRRVNHHEG